MYFFICSFHYLSFITDINECASSETNECHTNAVCNNTDGSFVCRCLDGYQGDGRSCTGKRFTFAHVCWLFGGFMIISCDLLSILVIITAVYLYVYDKLNYTCILIGSYLWSIGGQTHWWRQINVTLGLHSNRSQTTAPRTPFFLFVPHSDVIHDLILNRRTVTCNLFVNSKSDQHPLNHTLRSWE